MKECFIKSYNHHAFALGILQAYDEEGAMNFIKTNYIQLVWYEHDGEYTGYEMNFNINFFKYWDNFKREYLSNDILNKNNINIINYIENAIKSDKYLYLCLDEYYIPKRKAYNKYHFYHDVLVYGLDSQNEIFYLCGYDDNMNFNFSECSYSNMKDASPNNIELLSINKNYNYNINYDIIKYNINGLINYNEFGRFNSKFYDDRRIYGLGAVYKLKEYLNQIIETCSICNLIPFTVYYEHLKVVNSIIYSYNMNEHYHKMNLAINNMKILINLLLKHNILLKPDMLLRSKDILESCINDEHALLLELSNKINIFNI